MKTSDRVGRNMAVLVSRGAGGSRRGPGWIGVKGRGKPVG
jgi:hypothetical protein